MEDGKILETTLETLDRKIKEAETGEEAAKYAEAYAKKLDADTSEWKETVKQETERKKSKWMFLGGLAAAIGTALAAGIKVVGDILKIREIERIEEEKSIYVNTNKYK